MTLYVGQAFLRVFSVLARWCSSLSRYAVLVRDARSWLFFEYLLVCLVLLRRFAFPSYLFVGVLVVWRYLQARRCLWLCFVTVSLVVRCADWLACGWSVAGWDKEL